MFIIFTMVALLVYAAGFIWVGIKIQETNPETARNYAFLKQEEDEEDPKEQNPQIASLKQKLKEFEYREKNFTREIQELRQKLKNFTEQSLQNSASTQENHENDILNNGIIDDAQE